jgi:hypothetical protein
VLLGFLRACAIGRRTLFHRAQALDNAVINCLEVLEEPIATSIAAEVEATHLIEMKHGMFASLARNDLFFVVFGQLDDLPCFLVGFLNRNKKSFLGEIKQSSFL